MEDSRSDHWSPPQAKLEPEALARLRKPPLIWLTETFLLLLALGLLGQMIQAIRVVFAPAGTVSPFEILPQTLGTVVQLGLVVWLSAALHKRKRAGWYGALVFSLLMFASVTSVHVLRFMGTIGPLPAAAQHPVGTAVGEGILWLLTALYPLRLFFGAKVRAFLGVAPFQRRRPAP